MSALAFAPDGTLYSGGWDKHVRVWDTREEALRRGRRRACASSGAAASPWCAAPSTARRRWPSRWTRARPRLILGTEAATAAGIDVAFLQGDASRVPTPLGNTVARLARGQRLRFKSLHVEGVDVAVCDACVPPGVQGVLGAPFTERFDVAFDESTERGHPHARRRGAARARRRRAWCSRRAGGLHLRGATSTTSPWTRRAQRLGVAFSEEKAERTRAVYEREKKGIVEPHGPVERGRRWWTRPPARCCRSGPAHRGVVSTAGISPDGRSLATGGWDKRLYLWREGREAPVAERGFHPDTTLLVRDAWAAEQINQELSRAVAGVPGPG